MAKLFELPTDRGICCNTAETCGLLPEMPDRFQFATDQCQLCGSDQVVRLEPILDGGPDPPAQGAQQVRLALVRAVSA